VERKRKNEARNLIKKNMLFNKIVIAVKFPTKYHRMLPLIHLSG